MHIEINGERQEVTSDTVAQVLIELNYDAATVATALNGEFVAIGDRPTETLKDADRLEVLAPMQGG